MRGGLVGEVGVSVRSGRDEYEGWSGGGGVSVKGGRVGHVCRSLHRGRKRFVSQGDGGAVKQPED